MAEKLERLAEGRSGLVRLSDQHSAVDGYPVPWNLPDRGRVRVNVRRLVLVRPRERGRALGKMLPPNPKNAS